MTTTTTDNATPVAELERLKVLKNGEKVSLTFSDAEFERRLAGLRRIMAEKDLDAVVLTSYQSLKYYSDFLFTTFGRSYAWTASRAPAATGSTTSWWSARTGPRTSRSSRSDPNTTSSEPKIHRGSGAESDAAPLSADYAQ